MQPPKPIALVVDDDPALRLLIRVNLELEGFDVREAASVSEADAALAADRPAVVLLDMHLGSESSASLLRHYRDEGIPVAVVTGSVDVDDYTDLADAVLSKPFLPTVLVEIARRLARVSA